MADRIRKPVGADGLDVPNRTSLNRARHSTFFLLTFAAVLVDCLAAGLRLAGKHLMQANAAAKEGRMIKEFQEFIAKGNVMDLAVGVIIGGAFGLIVKSLTDDIIMPIVGAIFGGFDFSNYFFPLTSGVTAATLGRGQETRGRLRLRQFHHRRHQFPHPGLDHLHDGQGGEYHAPPA